MVLTQNDTFIIGPIAKLLGYVINWIFNLLNAIGIPNIGLAIILFTVVIYMLMLPLTIKQQKFSKLSAKMNPEIQAIQKKYGGKKDQVSLTKQNDETQAVYAKYGVSPTGSCLPLVVQLPILFALYRVIYAIPAYVTAVKDAFFPLVDKILANPAAVAFIQESSSAKQFAKKDFGLANTIIDVLNKFSVTEWSDFTKAFPDLSESIGSTQSTLNHFNNFLGLNIAETPWHIIKAAFVAGAVLLIIGAVLIPIFAGLTQWLTVKLAGNVTPPSNADPNDPAAAMNNSMKTMNNLMPLMSVYFCFILPAGMGLYWVASALVRMVQQFFINKKIEKIDWDAEIAKNVEKYNKKREKQGLPTSKANPTKNTTMAKFNTKTAGDDTPSVSSEDRDKKIKESTEYYNKGAAKPGSLASKARMVEQYNERTNKK